MALVELKGIGKIYVSEGNVAVGIRGVNLSFDKGEFVAVTGKSGSGKSTLLNVISGMDTYEEGELFVNGEPTSHYLQADWEEYRSKYISFIFQDYNIIESFTVLQNVELALMDIEDGVKRRRRALELLERVGLSSHIHHKGSKLSGGQKQRTVIARALAKDSPIILADEPTGNLDSRTSAEIIALLKEISKDKLVIVVTHNFDQLKDCATRHVRIFDGSVELDHRIAKPVGEPEKICEEVAESTDKDYQTKTARNTVLKKTLKTVKNGLTLGRVRFLSMPKLSMFLCILLIISSLAVTLVTSVSGDAFGIFEKDYIFTHIDGRVIIIRQDGAPISDSELAALAESVGASSYHHYDYLLDRKFGSTELGDEFRLYKFSFGDFEGIDVGRAPEADNEIMLSVPVSFKQYFKDGIDGLKFEGMFNLADYRVTGIRYYYDNTVTPQIIFTEKGYNSAAALLFFSDFLGSFSFSVKLEDNSVPPLENTTDFTSNDIYVSFDIPDGSFAFSAPNAVTEAMAELDAQVDATPGYSYTLQAVMSGKISQKQYDYYGGYYKADMIGGAAGEAIQYVMGREQYAPLSSVSNDVKNKARLAGKKVILSPEVIMSFMYGEYFENAYTQASLFFGSDGAALKAAEKLNGLGYVAVPSDATNLDDGLDALLETILLIFPLTGWIFAIIFIALFLSLCTSRAMIATKGDIAIMRSMGIATKVIKLSVYVQNLLALIPAYLFTAAVCTVVFTVPKTNGIFMFLHGWQYLLIASSLLAISLFLAKRHTKKMFSDSVKKTLKGSS